MRCNKVSIDIERFGKFVPESYPNDTQKIHVYCDDFNSVYAALSKAYALAINELAEYEKIGCRTDVYTNEFSKDNSIKTHGALIEWKRKYEEDVNLEYIDTHLELCKDRIWIYENSDEILKVLRECEGDVNLSTVLKEKFNLNDYQIRKLSQVRLDMMTKREYESLKNEIVLLEDEINGKDTYELYQKREIKNIQCKINKLKAYFVFIENYEKIANLILANDFDYDFQLIDYIVKEYEIDRDCVRNFKYMTLNDLDKSVQEKNKKELSRLENLLKLYSE